MINALTVDIEDYFHVEAFANVIPRSSWDSYKIRADRNTLEVLELLDRHGIRGTFFILGWLADRVPSIVVEIASRGHEIACHGYGHERITAIGPERFREDVRRAKSLLETVSGKKIRGYRAPSFSVTAASMWALDILVEEGFDYDSSIYPIVHDLYGNPAAARFPGPVSLPHGGTINEFPISTVRIGRVNLPVTGGGYLRILPLRWARQGIRHLNEVEGKPAVVYFHPWEIDPEQPRIKAPLKSRFRHYLNLEKTRGRLERLFGEFRFAPMADILDGRRTE